MVNNSLLAHFLDVLTIHLLQSLSSMSNTYSTGSDADLEEKMSQTERPYWLPTAIGFGSLLYVTHWCFGEVSLITRWVVKGYPHIGPQPYPWG